MPYRKYSQKTSSPAGNQTLNRIRGEVQQLVADREFNFYEMEPVEVTEILLNEKYGVIYSTQKKFVTNILEILDDKSKLKEIGKNGFEYVTKNHDWDILSKKILEKLKNIE